MIDTELAKYGTSGVAIAAFMALIVVVAYFLKFLQKSENRHNKSLIRLQKALNKNTKSADQSAKSSSELLILLKNMNGKFQKAYKNSIKESKE